MGGGKEKREKGKREKGKVVGGKGLRGGESVGERVVRWGYSALLYLLVPLLLVRLWRRSRRLRQPAAWRRLGERFGFVEAVPRAQSPVWVHAVSVGETIAAIPLIKALQHRYPRLRFIVTTTTPTGSERVRAAFGQQSLHCYMPYDLPDAVARFLRRINPCLLIIMETELWPNTLAACHRRGIPVVLANARLSAKSARGYRRLAMLTRPMLRRLSVVAAQHGDDRRRFAELGLPAAASAVTGSIKFDLTVSDAQLQAAAQLKRDWSNGGRRTVWLAASTHDGEDEEIVRAFAEVCNQLDNPLLVVVPRHPERFERVFELCRNHGYRLSRRSRGVATGPDIQIVLGDTMGELLVLFGACDIAFVGGSLIDRGGHNLIEPAAWGVPVLSGPSLFNFQEVSRLLQSVGGLTIVADYRQLASAVVALGRDGERRRRQGEAARDAAAANRGALNKLTGIIERFL